ncbi:hypothetical protein SETIT_3G352500v2 [Setaria italica]|uniref:Bifunctional inhibitor/plant lipid transfer protein/seed storage helical domain-containing protein n=1 Tax=Setaria italica TaxID=4555 RepID=A0A368QM41_SETIT|nr:hypothetical protein SETIT_3G352500v2 [Setaria italica]
MAPCRFCKHQGVAAGGLALLAALVVVGLALPGRAAAQRGQDGDTDVVIPGRVEEACRRSGLLGLLSCASRQKKDIQGCCGDLRSQAGTASDCACGVLQVIEDRDIDINFVCQQFPEAPRIQERCQAKAEEREGQLSNLDP